MATLFNEILYTIRGKCISDEAASIAAAEVAALVVKKFTSTNTQRDAIMPTLRKKVRCLRNCPKRK